MTFLCTKHEEYWQERCPYFAVSTVAPSKHATLSTCERRLALAVTATSRFLPHCVIVILPVAPTRSGTTHEATIACSATDLEIPEESSDQGVFE